MSAATIDLCYADVPFNTEKTQKIHGNSYGDTFKDYQRWLRKRCEQTHRLLKPSGSFFLHLDWREVHYAKVMLDELFGRENFRNEIIWFWDFGARSKNKWSCKHNTILWYTKSKDYTYNYSAIDRIPYMAPGLCGKDKAAKGKTYTDVWWNTIVHTSGKERVGYPTQKPLAILERIIKVHSNKGNRCLDWCAGSGSFGHAALLHKRRCVLIDKNPQAIKVMRKRFKSLGVKV
jgi:site-specific DNA-methyltransferase (adenine-specific)